jgi:hypothetical protein
MELKRSVQKMWKIQEKEVKEKKGKSTRELIKENEEMKNEILKYLVKNKQYYKSSSSSPETSTSEEFKINNKTRI